MTEARRIGPSTGVDDDTFDPPDEGAAAVTPDTVLSELKASLAVEDEREPVTLEVASRKRAAISIRYSTQLEFELMQSWRKRCTNKALADGFDSLKFACIVIANLAECVVMRGIDAHGSNGEPLNFKNPELLTMTNSAAAVSAVKHFFGNDGELLKHCTAVIEAAGYGEGGAAQTDPTGTL